MHISKITLINWGSFKPTTVTFGETTLLAGVSGSGKTSFLDAITAVMTGADSRLAKYNTGRTESNVGQSKKSRRTTASYVLGADGNGSYHRPDGAYGYACIVFEPDEADEGAGQTFSAVIGCHGRLTANDDAEISDVVRLVVAGALTTADFADPADGGTIPVKLLSRRLQDRGLEARAFGTIDEYMGTLYGALRGSRTTVTREESRQAAKAFVNAIAYKETGNVDDLIREEILEPVDNTDKLRNLMQTIRQVVELRKEAQRLEEAASMLDEVNRHTDAMGRHYADIRMFEALEPARILMEHESAAERHANEAEVAREDVVGIDVMLVKNEARQTELDERQRELEAALGDNSKYQQKAALEADVRRGKEAVDRQAGTLVGAAVSIADLMGAAKDFQFLVDQDLELAALMLPASDLAAAFGSVSISTLDKAIKDLNADAASVPAREEMLKQAKRLDEARILWTSVIVGSDEEDGAEDVIVRRQKAVNDAMAADEADRVRIRSSIRSLEGGKVDRPPETEDFLAALARAVPEARPRLLCDVIEITEQDWAGAIEGYIGSERYAVIYDPAHESKVQGFAKEFNKGRRKRVQVPQIGLALREGAGKVRPGSIVEMTRSDDDVAMGFLEARYGDALVCNDGRRLKDMRRGVMQDGWSTAGFYYSMRFAQPSDLCMGAESRLARLKALRVEEEELNDIIRAGKSLSAAIQKVRFALKARPNVEAEAVARGMAEAFDLIARAKADIARIDLSELDALLSEMDELKSAIEAAKAEGKELLGRKGARGEKAATAEENARQQTRFADLARPKADFERARFDALVAALPATIGMPLSVRFDEELRREDRAVNRFTRRASEIARELQEAASDLKESIREFRVVANEHENIKSQIPSIDFAPADFLLLLDALRREVQGTIRLMRNTGLPEKMLQLREHESNFTSAFTTDFCLTVLSDVERQGGTIDRINTNLRQTKFGNDTFRIVSDSKPEFEAYYSLFKNIRSLTAEGTPDLFSGKALSEVDKATLDRIKKLLLDTEESQAIAGLSEIADYRLYRRYDFERIPGEGKPVRLSTWGTGSGGETETPFYVIRSAVFASAFRHYSTKGAHFRTMVLDEGFTKMDDKRTRAVLDFLNKQVGVRVVVAAATKSMGPFLDKFEKRLAFSGYKANGRDWTDVNDTNMKVAFIAGLIGENKERVADDARAAFEEAEAPVSVAAE